MCGWAGFGRDFSDRKNKEYTIQQALIDKGILRPSGEIVKDKINLISGAHTPPFVEMLWMMTNGDKDTTDRVYNILTDLYQDGWETEMLEVLRTPYGVLGLPFPEDVEQLAGHTEAQGYFLFSFLLDYDNAIEDYKTEYAAAKKEMQEVLTAKANVDRLLSPEPEKLEKEKEQAQR